MTVYPQIMIKFSKFFIKYNNIFIVFWAGKKSGAQRVKAQNILTRYKMFGANIRIS